MIVRPVSFALVLVLSAAAVAAAAPAHDVAFWRAVARDHYTPPANTTAATLVGELVDMLASPDPEQRDDIAYSTLASWIYQQKLLDAAALRPIVGRLLANLARGVGERDTNTVFGRSFSALVLSVVIARDNVDPVLDAAGVARDRIGGLRVSVGRAGSARLRPRHRLDAPAAHTADLLKFLARSRYVAARQRRYLNAIAAKLTSASVVFTHGEDERFARAVLSLIARADFDAAQFDAWLQRTKPAVPEHPAVAQLRAAQNWKNLLAKLEVLLSNDPQPSDAATTARTAVRAAPQAAVLTTVGSKRGHHRYRTVARRASHVTHSPTFTNARSAGEVLPADGVGVVDEAADDGRVPARGELAVDRL